MENNGEMNAQPELSGISKDFFLYIFCLNLFYILNMKQPYILFRFTS